MSDSNRDDSEYEQEEEGEDPAELERRKKEEEVEEQVNRQIQLFERYLEESGISMAFQIIFAEILMKKVDPANVFTYAAMRLRQIGQEVAHLLPENLTEKLAQSK